MQKEIDQKISESYDIWLAEFQPDIVRIIGKFRKNFHHLDLEEVASQANLALIKGKEKLISTYDGEFNYSAFQKMAYTYVKNIINWSHYREDQRPYVNKRSDTVHESEDGPKTSFEMAIETLGYEDNCIDNLFVSKKYKMILDTIKKYYDILTENEVKIISMMEKGMKEEQIAESLQVTRQAVNFNMHKIIQKLNSYIKPKEVFNTDHKQVSQGINAINNFFDAKGSHGVAQEHSKFLKKTVLSKPYKYTIDDLVDICNKKFSTEYKRKQISCSLSKRKLFNFVAKKGKKDKTLERS